MVEIKENMYVRTEKGIHKIFKIDENKTTWKYLCDKKSTGEWDGSYECIPLKKEQIIKARFNPIDLIEVGDYVNGKKVGYIDDLEGAMRQYHYDYENPDKDVGHWGEEIKTIVTKEQFKFMEYRIGE